MLRQACAQVEKSNNLLKTTVWEASLEGEQPSKICTHCIHVDSASAERSVKTLHS